MSNDTTLPSGTGGDTIRTIDKGTSKTQVVALDLGGAGAESLVTGAIPVTGTFFQATQPVSGPATAVRRDSDDTAATDGGSSPLYMNQVGRLKVSAWPGAVAATTGSITTTQPAINTYVAGGSIYCNVQRMSNVMAYCTGTFAGVECYFEGSVDSTNGQDGNWFAVQAIRSNANIVENTTGSLSASPAYAWELSVNGLTFTRVRAISRTSGTQVWTIQPAPYATEPIPAAQVQPDTFVTGQGSQTASGQNIILATAGTGAYDASGFRSVAIAITPASGTVTLGQVTFEGSADNTNWQAVPLYDVASLTANPLSNYAVAASTTRYFAGPVIYRYLRARINVGLTGTTTGLQAFSRFSAAPYYSPQQTITQATAANLQATITGTISSATLAAGTNLAADVGLQQRSTTNNLTKSRVSSAATTNATLVKAAAGRIALISVFNDSGAKVYFKLFNKATAPVPGTDTPVLTIPLAAGAGFDRDYTFGSYFATGIGYTITGAVADLDTTVIGTGVTGELQII